MQRFNKTDFKHKFTYTWYTYLLGIVLSFFCWFWAFQAFHQPSAHQKLVLFVGAEIKDESFSNKILSQFEEKDLRLFDSNGCSPKKAGVYPNKLNVYLNNADLMILPEETIKTFTNSEQAEAVMDNYFRPFTDEVKSSYVPMGEHDYISIKNKENNDVDYAIAIKTGSVSSWLESYINFENDVNYYLLLTAASTNTGTLYSENNAAYTNALKSIRYLMEGVE